MTAADCLAHLMLGAMVIYSLLAGADFGAGFWDAWCIGPRANGQRHLIEEAIEPVWETNHIWLILLVVLMFAGFPSAFGAIGIALAIPLFLVLLGIVSRGASYVFRSYSVGGAATRRHWGRVFAISSSMTPVFLGIVVGAVSCDRIPDGYFQPWLRPMPICVGVLTLSLFSFLAACYLIVETNDPQLQDDFRLRALIAGAVATAMAVVTLVVSGFDAVQIRNRLLHDPLVWLIETAAVIASVIAFECLLHRRFRLARLAAAVQVALIVLGWGRAQFPFFIRPNLTLSDAAAPANVLIDLIIACVVGSVVLLPSLWLLLHVFKNKRHHPAPDESTEGLS